MAPRAPKSTTHSLTRINAFTLAGVLRKLLTPVEQSYGIRQLNLEKEFQLIADALATISHNFQ